MGGAVGLRTVYKQAMSVGGLLLASLAWTSPSPAGAVDCASTYAVQAGDSWSRISHATGIYIRPLAAANGLTRESPLHPGMTLCVPAATATNSPQRAPSSEPSTPTMASDPATSQPDQPKQAPPATVACDATHTVAPQESWSSIASRYHVRVRALLAANKATSKTIIHPGGTVCVPAASVSPETPNTATTVTTATTTTTTTPPANDSPASDGPAKGTCEAAIASYGRAMCMDLSERRAIIGGRRGTSAEFPAVGGYGPIEECARTVPGTFHVGNKQPITPRRKLRWGISFGGGCIGDQIVHTVSRATLESARGTGGCIGLLEADAKAAYDTLNIGDAIVIIA
jgi:LysM repeat protein